MGKAVKSGGGGLVQLTIPVIAYRDCGKSDNFRLQFLSTGICANNAVLLTATLL